MCGKDIHNTEQYKKVTHFRNLVARDINGHKYRYMGAAHSMIFLSVWFMYFYVNLAQFFANCSTLKSECHSQVFHNWSLF